MAKEKKDVFDFELLKNFFNVRFNIWIIIAALIVSFFIYLYSSRFQPAVIFPARNDLAFEFYTDSGNGGNSTILSHSITDSAIAMDFVLRGGFASPYVGMGITNRKDSVFNLEPYNRIRLEIAGEQIRSIGIAVFATNSYDTSRNQAYFAINMDIGPDRKQYVIDLDKLIVPDWWYASNNISTNAKMKLDSRNISRITVGSALTSASDVRRSLKIYSMSFERDNGRLILLLILADFIVFLLLGVIHYIRAYRAIPITITYKPVDTEQENRQINSFLDYINNHFHDPNLTLQQVSDQTGINQRRITASIQESFNCNFKTYINRLRINESKRLLVETELNMGEIAYKVGFSNQTHFNRVFKTFENISPSQFLRSKKQ